MMREPATPDVRQITMHIILRAAVLVTFMVLLASCSLISADEDDLPLDGREFISDSFYVRDGQQVPLVVGTQIRLKFGEEELQAGAGCNSMSGSFDIEGDRLVTEDVAQTMMGCDPERHAQDDLLAQLLAAEPTITLTGNQLVLRSDEIEVTLTDADIVNPDRNLQGTTWEVDGFSRGPTAMSMATPRRANFALGPDNIVRGNDGCNPFEGTFSLDGDQIRFDIDRSEEGGACENQDYVEEFYLSLRETLTARINGDSLDLFDAAGMGLTAKALDG